MARDALLAIQGGGRAGARSRDPACGDASVEVCAARDAATFALARSEVAGQALDGAGATLALTRLLRLASPALPVGAYAYSQGLESAIALGWVRDEAQLERWMGEVLELSLARFDAPVLARLQRAWQTGDDIAVRAWNARTLAARETAELRAESCHVGEALRTLFEKTAEFSLEQLKALRAIDPVAFPTVFSFAAACWRIPERAALAAYLFAWIENQVQAAVKCSRLGHVGAQRVLATLSERLPSLAERALELGDDDLCNSLPALAIASSLHETAASRMFRS